MGGRTLNLLLEGDAEKSLYLMQVLVGLRVWLVRDVLQRAGSGRHVVCRSGEA
jgi:hypothetical protein